MKHAFRAATLLFSVAFLSLSLRADRTEVLWQKLPGDYTWLGGAGSNTERGIAYNAPSNQVYVVSRQAPLGIHVLDATTGDEILGVDNPETTDVDESTLPLTLNMTDVAGSAPGGFALNMIGVAEDGVIYAANLTTGSGTSPFKIYRWTNALSVPTIAYEGNPGDTNSLRFGDTFDVRGSGPNTQVMAGSRNTPHVAIFTTTDGENFTANLISGAAATGGSLGVAFGSGNSGWSKLNGGNQLRHFSFDLTTKAATLIESITLTPDTLGVIGSDPTGKYLGIMAAAVAPAIARVLDVSAGGAILVGNHTFDAAANPNSNGVGGIDIGGNKAFFVNPNNGILALNIIVEATPITIATQPANTTVIETGMVTLSVSAAGTPPLTYQWTHAGTNLPGATFSSLRITNASAAEHAGEYQVVVNNAAGPVTSNPATLTVAPLTRGNQLTLKWRINAGELPWLGDDLNTRGIAINTNGNILVVTHPVGQTPEVRVLDGNTGAEKHRLSVPSLVTGGTFALNMIGIADDGAVYIANLTTDSTAVPFAVYRWPSDAADAQPELVYLGDPSGGGNIRFGDSLDVRGAGETTQIIAGSRAGNNVALIFPNTDPSAFAATPITVTDAPAGAFGLNVAFGEGNSFYGTSPSQPLHFVTHDQPVPGEALTGTLVRTYTAEEIPTGVAAVDYDVATRFLAGLTLENPDGVRLYSIPNVVTEAPTLVDHELFTIDNNNGNGTGSLDFGFGKLAVVNTQNGIMVFDFNPGGGTVDEPTLSAPQIAANGNVTITVAGAAGTTFTVQAANSLTAPINWSNVGNVTIGAGGTATITDTAATGQNQRYYRAVSTPTP